MKWQNNDPGYLVTDSKRTDRKLSIDAFLRTAFLKIGEIYEYQNCPAIIFDLRETTILQVYDSPDGLEINGSEKFNATFSQSNFDIFWNGYILGVIECVGTSSEQYEKATCRAEQLTWSAIRSSIQEGTAKHELQKFNLQPALISVYEGNDWMAHDLVTGKRIEMVGKPVELENQTQCICRYCKPII